MEEKGMLPSEQKMRLRKAVVLFLMIIAILLGVPGHNRCDAAKPIRQKMFDSPQEAVKVMVDAMKSADTNKLLAIFGPASKDLFSSGDDASDRRTRDEFVKAYTEKNRLEAVGKKKKVLYVGKDAWAWPIPIVKTGAKWRFDTRTGSQEILARRIGENELAVIQVCLAYVDAQREYAWEHRSGGIETYARQFFSDPGKTNGLCCEQKDGLKQSLMGPLIGKACKTGQDHVQSSGLPQPYHGYYYKILQKQGRYAHGGAYDYVVDGKMIGGFALVAYPAKYSSSGIMSFIVNQDNVVYEKDLGKNTEKIAETMTGYDPDQTWNRADRIE